MTDPSCNPQFMGNLPRAAGGVAVGPSDSATVTVEQVITALSRVNRLVNSEAELQLVVEDDLRTHFPGKVLSQVRLGAAGRVDILVDTVAVELKTQGTFVAVLRQCARYAGSDQVSAVVLASTTRTLVRGLPDRLCGKPIHAVLIGGGERS